MILKKKKKKKQERYQRYSSESGSLYRDCVSRNRRIRISRERKREKEKLVTFSRNHVRIYVRGRYIKLGKYHDEMRNKKQKVSRAHLHLRVGAKGEILRAKLKEIMATFWSVGILLIKLFKMTKKT